MEFLKIYILDIFFILLFAGCLVYYYCKGFVRSLLELFALAAAAIVTRAYTPAVVTWVMQNSDLFTGDWGQKKAYLVIGILLFILVSLVLKLIILIIDKAFDLPVIRTANKLLGLVLGAVCGFLLVCAGAAIVQMLLLTGSGTVQTLASHSRVLPVVRQALAYVYPAVAEVLQGGLQK